MGNAEAPHTPIVERVVIAGRSWSLWRPPSAEDLIDEDAYAVDERLPYWAELWPSAHVLAETLGARDLAGARVLELGCGLGLPSLVAASAGAAVTATDWYPEALEFVRRNGAEAGVDLTTRMLDWFDPDAAREADGPYDLIAGADVLYEDRNGEALAALIPVLLSPGGEVLITDPRRPNARTLLQPLNEAGWSLRTDEVRHGARRDETGAIVHLHRLSPPA